MIPGYGMHEGSDQGNGSPIIGACENAMALRERMRLVVYWVQHLTARPCILILLEGAGFFGKVSQWKVFSQLSSAIISYHQPQY